ncbi:uncharacterized protein LOC125877469 [Solanum stenotomum]|uniref:uncharacterized protein LOC125877469 n=1 Tax=Solanum stenotomum TaxID=172797 RepID=UPI0020D023E0|nr:uncharacterized protein LOC125877469 [Solanum stenotomum]
MNPSEFHGFKVEEDPQEFIDEIHKILMIMGVTLVEMEVLAAYKLKGVAQVLYNQWSERRPEDAGPLDWEKFKSALLDRFFPVEMREAKGLEFINLRQGSICVREYAQKFTELCMYAQTMFADSSAKMSKFVSGVYEMVVKKCRTQMLIHDIDILVLWHMHNKLRRINSRKSLERQSGPRR